jgi:HAD superfamily hydrolase (TIGR01509 family)
MKPDIIFDLGKVLVDFDWSIAAKKIAARSTAPPEQFHHHLATSPLLWQYECGQLTRQDFFESVRAAIGFQGDETEFNSYFAAIFTAIDPMIALHDELRQRGYKTYILSNTNDMAIELVRRDFPFFKNFDGYIFSYEVRSMKPDAPIYAALEKLTGKSGADLIYIDDRLENIEAGAARGWRTVLHEVPEKTRAALMAFGVIES